VYTAVTLAEYYRQMGLNVLLLADSTSRWAQAMREMSGRLEEIPGEEAFPAYLESTIASFYERAGIVRLRDGSLGSVTIGGTVSPAGGNFEEPVTQATLKVVGAFHGLSRERSDARKFPAIHPLDSWSKYKGIIDAEKVGYAHSFMRRGTEVEQMMKVVGEEGTTIEDYVIFLKGDLIDSVYFQQNSFDAVDAAVKPERQIYVFRVLIKILGSKFPFEDKNEARSWFNKLRQRFLDFNGSEWQNDRFKAMESEIHTMIGELSGGLDSTAEKLLA
jgi:V/A-type H+-transporting ATPase subunit A